MRNPHTYIITTTTTNIMKVNIIDIVFMLNKYVNYFSSSLYK